MNHAVKAGVHNLKEICKRLPPCVRFAVVSSWLNGWATARRLQRHSTRVFCKKASSEDAIEHYAVCQVVKRAACSIYGREINLDLGSFLLLHDCSLDVALFRATFLYAVRKASAFRRAGNGDPRCINDLRLIRNMFKMVNF